MRRHGKRGSSLQEYRLDEVVSQASRGVEFCVVIVAALIQKYARLIMAPYYYLLYGGLRGTAGVPGVWADGPGYRGGTGGPGRWSPGSCGSGPG